MHICCCCLSTYGDRRLSDTLAGTYHDVTGIFLEEERHLRVLCANCLAYLRKCKMLRDTAQKANKLLNELISQNKLNDTQFLNENGLENMKSLIDAHNACLQILPRYTIVHKVSETYIPEAQSLTLDDAAGSFIKVEISEEKFHDGESSEFDNNKLEDYEYYDAVGGMKNTENHVFKVENCKDPTVLDCKPLEIKPKAPKKEQKNCGKRKRRVINNSLTVEESGAHIKTIESEKVAAKKKGVQKRSVKKENHKNDDDIKMEISDLDSIINDTDTSDSDSTYVCSDSDRSDIDQSKKKHIKRTRTTKRKVREEPKVTSQMLCDKKVKTLFKIEKLSLEEQIDNILKRRDRPSGSYRKLKFKCDKCYTGFSDEKLFELHMDKHSERNGQYSCPVCKLRFTKECYAQTHQKNKHSMRYNCMECNFQTLVKTSAAGHVDWHEGKRYKCEICSKDFEHPTTLLSHVRLVHGSSHVCVYCGHMFLQRGMDAHVRIKHPHQTVPEDGPECVECSIKFANTDALETHLRYSKRHSYKSVPTPSKAQIEWSKARNKPVTCETCGEQCMNKASYSWHLKKHHPEQIEGKPMKNVKTTLCDICGKAFRGSRLLRFHLKESHSSEAIEYKCGYCPKVFHTSVQFYCHRRLHTVVRKCNICSKTFNNSQNLTRHKKTVHSTARDFKCDFCSKCFKTATEAKGHANYVHLKKPWPKKSGKRPKAELEDVETLAASK